MALVVKDRVQETTVSIGTGSIVLGGAVAGFQSFSAIGDGNTTYYTITDGTNWEVGIGTYTVLGLILSRDTVLESSNGGSLVNFGVGTKQVFCTYPAERSVLTDDIGATVQGYDATTTKNAATQTLTNKTISGASNTLSNIANASLTNSAITINGTSVSLGGSVSVGGMTLLGTLTTTSGSTQTLSSLTLTDYKQLQIVFNGVSSNTGSGSYRITDPDTTVLNLGNVSSTASNRISAITNIDLSSGVLVHNGWNATPSTTPNIGTGQTPVAGKTTFSTSATAVTISLSTGNFDAGTILVYGVK